jgi:hypothetical protein
MAIHPENDPPRPDPVHPPKMGYKNRRQSGIQNGVWRLSKNGGILRLLPEARIGFELSVLREMGTVSSLRFVTFLEIPMASDVTTVVLEIRPPHA